VPAEHQQRLVDLLGHRHSRWLGLIE
jgi:hypothetical protein